LARSWVPGYLARRGIDTSMARRWDIGYAPGGRATLAGHLRALGYGGAAIRAAGLAWQTRGGELADFFRDRATLAIRDQAGTIARFIGRARPGAPPGVPKYLNIPQTRPLSQR
jgi:DNA primase